MNKVSVPVLMISLLLGGCPEQADAVACPEPLDPIVAPLPVLPGKTENSFRGSVMAHVTIEKDGTVANAEISAVALQRVGRGRQEPVGYKEAVLRAVRNWRYPAQNYRCVKEVTVQFEQ